ncbi:hypothetical protein AB0C04_14375 [Micromonospora sp. NPDC048909]|uniref:hypothetical protein n=1 Tax=Micromonospora sp. NPDC048909 TaxID=3155643 RepID=UPI0033C91CFF
MSQPPTGPQGFPSAYPAQPPAAPGQPAQPPAAPGQPAQPPAAPGQPAPAGTPYPPQQPDPQYGTGQPAPQQPGGYGFAHPEPPTAPTVPFSAPPADPYAAPTTAFPTVAAPGGYPAPASAQPMSAPPVSGPAYGQPMSAPPVSGPAYGQPMSAPPGAVPPYGPTAPTAGKTRPVLILALVAGLLFVLGGVMTGLYVTKSGELERTEQRLSGQVSERDGTIAANTKELEKVRVDLQGMQDKLADTEQDLTGTRNDRDEQARQKKVIASCLDKLTTALAAASAGNRSEYEKATKGLNKVCDEAENYL